MPYQQFSKLFSAIAVKDMSDGALVAQVGMNGCLI